MTSLTLSLAKKQWKETLELKEKFDEEYNGIDGHVYTWHKKNFHQNLLGQYADEVELRKIMKKELAPSPPRPAIGGGDRWATLTPSSNSA